MRRASLLMTSILALALAAPAAAAEVELPSEPPLVDMLEAMSTAD